MTEAIQSSRAILLAKKSRILNQEDFIFVMNKGESVSYSHVYTLFTKMSKDVGFKVWPHKMRHAFSTRAFDIPGLTPKDVMNALGHTKMDMTMKYNTGTPEGMMKVVNATLN